ILVGSGVYTLSHSNRLASMGDLAVAVPFTGVAHVEKENDARVVLDQRFPDRGRAGGLTLDRYALRDINQDLMKNYAKITNPGVGTEFEEGQVVSKEEFEKAVSAQRQQMDNLLAEAKELEASGQPLQARSRRDEAENLRRRLPEAEEPTPAT